MADNDGDKWVRISSITVIAVTTAAISITAAIFSASICRRVSKRLASRIRELEASLEASAEQAASERRGRVRVQQELRKALSQQSSSASKSDSSSSPSSSFYPMAPIGIVQSCFSTRNGTPRQPLLAPLSRACLVFNPSRVPAQALDGLSGYSHCWILYVFHLNTNLEKLWEQPSRSKFKAKVRVPRLKGGKMGVFATRSPHRPCPIGLTVAKVEALDGHAVLLSGIDLVDGTPVLDIKPYLPYSDCIKTATVPNWVKAENALSMASVSFSVDFLPSLSSCWALTEKHSLYASIEEFQSLIKEVLSWDIRSLSQQTRPHHSVENLINGGGMDLLESESNDSNELDQELKHESSSPSVTDITYNVILEGVYISYRIDDDSNITVEKATLLPDAKNSMNNRYNYLMWREKSGHQKSDRF